MQGILQKKVLILGATGGIGSETARLLHKSGAQLYLSGRNTEKLQALAQELSIPTQRCFVLDLQDSAGIRAMAQSIHAEIPQLDVLVNAAGLGIIKNLEQLSEEDFDRSIAINLKATFLLLQQFLPPMKQSKKGLIIHIPGVLGKTPMAGAAAYAASKYGLNGLLKSVREELKRTQIRITNLYLGGTDTPFWDKIDLKVQRDQFVLAQEAAKSIWFLCQQPSSAVVSEMVIQPFNHQAI
jgi:NADP-dependent 3-hydroxy acid dehydrogenase YdfG